MSEFVIHELLTEGRPCPLGVNADAPCFSWSFGQASHRSSRQTAYRIVVASSEQLLIEGNFDQWDSGIVRSSKHTNIRYQGKPLHSRQRYYWQVTVWDDLEHVVVSRMSWWEMGLLSPEHWSGKWIGESEAADGRLELPQFRYTFPVKGVIRQARAYISGLGHYELRLNGQKVGDHQLDPGWTNYNKTVLYTVYDITEHLQQGSNAVGVMLGNGFYNVTGGRYTKFKASFGKPKCLVNLVIDYANGSSETIRTNEDWQVSSSPLTFSCMYGGEDYDARREQTGWDYAEFKLNGQWANAVEVPAPAGLLTAQTAPAVKMMQLFESKSITEPKPGVYVIDLGQNFSGWTEIAVSGAAGAVVTLTPAELLTDEGLANQRHTGAPYKFNYTLKGDGIETWRPRFTYYGFRYVQVEGAVPEEHIAASRTAMPVLHRIQGQMLYPEIKLTGEFRCSDDLLNRIHEIIQWAMLSNMKSVFTDCPHREKLGWLEQIHLMGPSLMFNYDIEALLMKVMNDMADAQQPNGLVPTTAPEYVVFQPPWDMFRDAAAWGGAYILAAWEMLARFGNASVLVQHYEGMQRYLHYLKRKAVDYILPIGLGDWYDIGPKGPGFAQNTPVPYAETAIFYGLARVMQKIANLLDRPQDALAYLELSSQIYAAFQREFYDADTQQYATGSDASIAMAIAIGLAPREQHEHMIQQLEDNIVRRGYQTTAGDVGHRYVLLTLARAGKSELIYRMTRNTEAPSYGYQIVHGATTLTEAWDGPTVGKSQNHFMLGHLEEWLYSHLAGLDYRYHPDQQHYSLIVKPNIVGNLSWAEAKFELRSGRAAVHWFRDELQQVTMNVEVPFNTDALIYVPAATQEQVTESGNKLEGMKGVTCIGYEQGYAIFRTGSGKYKFHSTL